MEIHLSIFVMHIQCRIADKGNSLHIQAHFRTHAKWKYLHPGMLALCPLALTPSGNIRIQAHFLPRRVSVQKDGVGAINISVW
jgi:hypothetical protein